MRKIFLIPTFLIFNCATGCLVKPAEPEPNGKSISDYDISNNIETICYLNDTFETEDFTFEAFFQDYRYWGGCGMCFKIDAKNDKKKRYDVLEAYLCDRSGENKIPLIEQPVTYKFFDLNYGYESIYYYQGGFSLRYDLEKKNKEYVVVTQDRNFIFHCWDKPSNYQESDKQITEYVENLTPIVSYYENTAKHDNYGSFSVKRFSGKWISDTLQIETSCDEVDLLSVYLTDANNDNVKNLLDSPRNYKKENNNPIYIDINDANQEYYESCDNKVKIHIITSNEKIVFYTWRTQENGKTKDDYDLSNNKVFEGSIGESLGDNKEFRCYLRNNSNLRVFIAPTDKAKYDVVEIYLTDFNGDNRVDILSKPRTLLFNNETYGITLEFDNVMDFKEYFLDHEKKITFHLITEESNVKFNLTENEQNHLGITQ